MEPIIFVLCWLFDAISRVLDWLLPVIEGQDEL